MQMSLYVLLLFLGVTGLQWKGNVQQYAFNMNTDTMSALISAAPPHSFSQIRTIARLFESPALRVLAHLIYAEDWVIDLCTAIRFVPHYHPTFLQWKWISNNPACKFIFHAPRPDNYIFHGIFDHNISHEASIIDMDVVENVMLHRHAILDFSQLQKRCYPWVVGPINGWRWVDLEQDGRDAEIAFEYYLLQKGPACRQSKQLKLLRLWHRKQIKRLIMEDESANALRQQALEENSSLSAILSRCFNLESDCGRADEERILSLTWELIATLDDRKEASMWIGDTLFALMYAKKLNNRTICKEFARITNTFTAKEISPLSFSRILQTMHQRGICECNQTAPGKFNSVLVELLRFDVLHVSPLLPLSFRHAIWQSRIVAGSVWRIPLALAADPDHIQLSISIHSAGPLWNLVDRLHRPVSFHNIIYTSLTDLLQSYTSFMIKSRRFIYAGPVCGYIPNLEYNYYKVFIYPVVKAVLYLYFVTGKWLMFGRPFTDYISEYSDKKSKIHFLEKEGELEKCFNDQVFTKARIKEAIREMLQESAFIGIDTFYRFSYSFYPHDFGLIEP